MSDSSRNVIDQLYLNEVAHQIRWKKTLEFIAGSSGAVNGMERGLDLGGRTPLTDMLEKHVLCPFDNTCVDLDTGILEDRYGVVTAFEVVEHLFNPLHALLQVRNVFCGKDPRLFLSIPLRKPELLGSPGHFHEMTRREALLLFGRAGFSVVRSSEFRIRHPLFYLTGVKPMMRAFYEKVLIYELKRT
ncbi:MAG: class I SAM-dependent methyltransferase [Chlorobiaceae bacterium]|nr:class I SAM-dependent methyltransferase [Chlorobiaceae bacterium]